TGCTCLQPDWASLATTREPRNPAPPVTQIRLSTRDANLCCSPPISVEVTTFVVSYHPLSLRELQIVLNHDLDQFLKANLRLPAEFLTSFSRVAKQQIYFGWPVVAFINVHALLPVDVEQPKRLIEKIADRMRLAGCDDVVVGLVCLHHQIHRLHEVPSVTPVAPRFEIAEIKFPLQSHLDSRSRPRNLASHERLASSLALVIEQDAIAGKKIVRLAIVDGDVVRVRLRATVRRSRIKGRRLLLRNLADLAKQLR